MFSKEHDVEEPLQPVSVGEQMASKESLHRPADHYFSNKMMDIQQNWLENELQRKQPPVVSDGKKHQSKNSNSSVYR
jgi:hypothetical protein